MSQPFKMSDSKGNLEIEGGIGGASYTIRKKTNTLVYDEINTYKINFVINN